MITEKLQYAAGFLDVRGSFKKNKIILKLVESKLKVLEFFTDEFGGTLDVFDSDYCMWTIGGMEMKVTIDLIKPHMIVRFNKEFVEDNFKAPKPWISGYIDANSSITKNGQIKFTHDTKDIPRMFEQIYGGKVVEEGSSYNYELYSLTNILMKDVYPYVILKKDVIKPFIEKEVKKSKLPTGVYQYDVKTIISKIIHAGKDYTLGYFSNDEIEKAEQKYIKYKSLILRKKKEGVPVNMSKLIADEEDANVHCKDEAGPSNWMETAIESEAINIAAIESEAIDAAAVESEAIANFIAPYKQLSLGESDIETLQYAAGISDTDGCFQFSIIGKRLKFYICQAERGYDAIKFMYDKFGGEITLHKVGNENHQTSYDWSLYNSDAVKYANAILPYLVLKKREALVFVSDLSKQEIDQKLRKLKKEPHEDIPEAFIPSKPYIAGIMDGEGCFEVNGKSGQHHGVTQKWPQLLQMLYSVYGGSIWYRKGNDSWAWSVHTEAKRLVKDIAPYIQGKKKQVELLLNMKPGEAPEVHVKLRELKGNCTSATPRIDALNEGAHGIRASVTKEHTAPKKLPAGVFMFGTSKTRVKAQIQYDKKIYILGTFDIEEVDKAHMLYLKYKDAISAMKRGGPKVDFTGLEFWERK